MKQENIGSKIHAVAFHPEDKNRIISCEENTGVQLRDVGNRLVGDALDSSCSGLAVAVSRNGRWIVTGTADGVTIWDKDMKKQVHHKIKGVRTIDISADSKWAVTGSDDRTVDIWDLSTGQRRYDTLKHEYHVVAVKFCPCGERLATATLFGSIRIFNVNLGKKLFTIPVSVTSTFAVFNTGIGWFFSPSRLYVASQGQIKCLNSNDGSIIYQWAMRKVSFPSCIAISPNGKIIAYSANEVVTLRDIATREQIGDTLKHDGNVMCLAFSPGSERLVVGADTKYTIWDLEKNVTDRSLLDTTAKPPGVCKHEDMKKGPPPTFLLPLMSITNEAVKPWLHGFLKEAEEVFTKEIASPACNYNTFANRAIMRARLRKEGEGLDNAARSKKAADALEDAKQSLQIQKSAIGQIAKTFALIEKNEFELATEEAPKVVQICPPEQHETLLKVIEKILACLAGNYEKVYPEVTNLTGDRTLLLLVQANMHLFQENFDSAMRSFRNAHVPVMFPYDETQDMRTVSYIFGWKFSGLGVQIQQRKCDYLLKCDKAESADLFSEVMKNYHREIVTHVELSDWAIEFRRDCVKKLENLGDKSHQSGKYSEAAKYYTAVISLVGEPELKHALLLKRCESYVQMGSASWNNALMDANEAVRLNSYSPWGHEKRHLVLYKQNHYQAAAEALDKVFDNITFSDDPKSKRLREKGVKPYDRKRIILGVVDETFNGPRPHMLINTESRRLCDKKKQTEAYRAHPSYKDLVLQEDSPVGKVGTPWQESVRKYFQYCTLSHTWEDSGELEYRDVEPRLPVQLQNDFSDRKPESLKKLQTFCQKTQDLGFFWAWSDTCCINKAEKDVLDVSLRSMYRWYSESSLTIVHLKGVVDQLTQVDVQALSEADLDEQLDTFVKCKWNQRAWTLQEYFASAVIHFYTGNWDPYLTVDSYHPVNNPINHKEHRAIQRGMQLVTQLDPAHLASLKPGTDDARQKLRLASARKASRKEDVAYSLLGIFQVTIEAVYGDDEVPRALGRLLGALVSQSGDVSILAWTGKASEYNSCLPGEITVFKKMESDHIPEPMEEATIAASVSSVLSSLSPEDLDSAIKLHDRLLDCPPPEMLHGRLKLSCILFPVQAVNANRARNSYIVTVKLIGDIEIFTTEELSVSRNMVLVHPWFRHLLNPGISMSEPIRKESGGKLVVALRKRFGALLFAFNRAAQDYRRIVADHLIEVQIPDSVTPKQLWDSVHVLHIR